MDTRKTALQRAFELAQTGKYLNVLETIKCLKAEKYDSDQVEGPALKKQLFQFEKSGQSVERTKGVASEFFEPN